MHNLGWLVLATPQLVPRGVFSDIPKLKACDLSHNSMKALPDDIAALRCVQHRRCCIAHTVYRVGGTAHAGCWCLCSCRELQSFMLQHNCLSALPLSMYSLTALKTLDVSYNRLTQLQHEIGNIEGLQVCGASGPEQLRACWKQPFNTFGATYAQLCQTLIANRWQQRQQCFCGKEVKAHCRGLM